MKILDEILLNWNNGILCLLAWAVYSTYIDPLI